MPLEPLVIVAWALCAALFAAYAASVAGEITYVNVREPSTPAYRRIDSGTVQPGSGA